MSGLLRRIRLRRAAPDGPAEQAAPDEAAADASLPAGAEPDLLGERPDGRRRGRARRRLRHVRRVRELYLRDLGGFVYELHRRGGGEDERHSAVMLAKLERLGALDAERADLEERLDERSGELLLREPGVGGTCPTCGELHGSEARFCSHCGMPLAPGAARPVPGLATGEQAALPAPGADPMARVKEHVAAAQSAEPLAAGSPAPSPRADADATAEPLPDTEVVDAESETRVLRGSEDSR
jgi:hypothetical protein